MDKIEIELGGKRLGDGSKMKQNLRTYNRSNHDLSYNWGSTMASGVLVPFMTEYGTNGDTFDINLNAEVLTLPTNGPLFGSYKVQMDVFKMPLRNYNAMLNMNAPKVAMSMDSAYLPQMKLEAKEYDKEKDISNAQINPSCILHYLGIKGVAGTFVNNMQGRYRDFNASALIMYWDTYLHYYANKQENVGFVIHNDFENINTGVTDVVTTFEEDSTTTAWTLNIIPLTNSIIEETNLNNIRWVSNDERENEKVFISLSNPTEISPDSFIFYTRWNGDDNKFTAKKGSEVYQDWYYDAPNSQMIGTSPVGETPDKRLYILNKFSYDSTANISYDIEPKMKMFDLNEIYRMRREMQKADDNVPFYVTEKAISPYQELFYKGHNPVTDTTLWSRLSNMEGLGCKTYQSDLFNNWLDKEVIDGDNGLNEVSKIDVSGGYLHLDTLNLQKKIYEMFARIAASGGTFEDWQTVIFSEKVNRTQTQPSYEGGLIKELAFQQVISNASVEKQPLGTLAGRGTLTDKHHGGNIIIRCDEPTIIMGIVSITPRLTYSQGNKWYNRLRTFDDFHKPQMDGLGYEDLITDQMAWWTTSIDENGVVIYKSAGKQPAWINYTTNVNETHGNFAKKYEQMFMTLNRNYEFEGGGLSADIADLTTYIDPKKFNDVFADTRRDAQNFWVNLFVNINCRRLMSAFQIPNL